MLKRFMGMLTVLGVMLVAGVASAHVTVWPKESQAGGYERYTIRVPTEKAVPTVKLRVLVPQGTAFSSVLPVPGWTFDTEKDASGAVTALDWSGGEIKPGEFFEFGISVKNPKSAGPTTWKTYQTYSDGTVVEWTGPSDANTPAPVVTLKEAPATGTGQQGTPAATAPAATATPAAPAPPAANFGLGTWLGGTSILISLAALFTAVKTKKRE